MLLVMAGISGMGEGVVWSGCGDDVVFPRKKNGLNSSTRFQTRLGAAWFGVLALAGWKGQGRERSQP